MPGVSLVSCADAERRASVRQRSVPRGGGTNAVRRRQTVAPAYNVPTPDMQGPECTPTRIRRGLPSRADFTLAAASTIARANTSGRRGQAGEKDMLEQCVAIQGCFRRRFSASCGGRPRKGATAEGNGCGSEANSEAGRPCRLRTQNGTSVFLARHRCPRDHHVGVTDCLHLVHTTLFRRLVKA